MSVSSNSIKALAEDLRPQFVKYMNEEWFEDTTELLCSALDSYLSKEMGELEDDFATDLMEEILDTIQFGCDY